jgi:KDEL-tailed cysteine endopeptidase
MASTLMNKLVIVVLAVLGSWATEAMARTLPEAAASMAERHEQWMAQYDRKYSDDAEKESRLQKFKENAEFVEKFNSEGNRTYKLSLNAFADLSAEEFVASRTGYKMRSNQSRSDNINASFMYESLTDIPMSMDWRDQEAVTPIKNQGKCGKKLFCIFLHLLLFLLKYYRSRLTKQTTRNKDKSTLNKALAVNYGV